MKIVSIMLWFKKKFYLPQFRRWLINCIYWIYIEYISNTYMHLEINEKNLLMKMNSRGPSFSNYQTVQKNFNLKLLN